MVYILVMVSSTSGGFLLTLSPICTGFDDFMGVNVGGAARSRGEVVCGPRRCPNPTGRVFFLTWIVVLYFFSAISMKHALSCAGR